MPIKIEVKKNINISVAWINGNFYNSSKILNIILAKRHFSNANCIIFLLQGYYRDFHQNDGMHKCWQWLEW